MSVCFVFHEKRCCKLKWKFLVLLVALLFIFSSTCVSAEDNHTEMISETPNYHSFAELNQSITNSGSEFTFEHDYKYEGGEINITINKPGSFTMNGNNHVLDGVKEYNSISFNSTGVVTVKNLTFQNFKDSAIMINSPVIFDNVKFINCSGSDLDDFITANNNTQFNNCILQNNGALSNFIHCCDDAFVFKNTQFYQISERILRPLLGWR